jgi:hypothetical protein
MSVSFTLTPIKYFIYMQDTDKFIKPQTPDPAPRTNYKKTILINPNIYLLLTN